MYGLILPQGRDMLLLHACLITEHSAPGQGYGSELLHTYVHEVTSPHVEDSLCKAKSEGPLGARL